MGDSTAERELRKYIFQLLKGADPEEADWDPYHEQEVDSAKFFIEEELNTGEYAILQLHTIEGAYSAHYVAVRICGVTTEQFVKERNKGEPLILPGIDRSLALGVPSPQTRASSMANRRWIFKEGVTCPYA